MKPHFDSYKGLLSKVNLLFWVHISRCAFAMSLLISKEPLWIFGKASCRGQQNLLSNTVDERQSSRSKWSPTEICWFSYGISTCCTYTLLVQKSSRYILVEEDTVELWLPLLKRTCRESTSLYTLEYRYIPIEAHSNELWAQFVCVPVGR